MTGSPSPLSPKRTISTGPRPAQPIAGEPLGASVGVKELNPTVGRWAAFDRPSGPQACPAVSGPPFDPETGAFGVQLP